MGLLDKIYPMPEPPPPLPEGDIRRRPSEAELAVVPCDYCRNTLREILRYTDPGLPLLPGAYVFLNGQARILAHTAAGHPEG